MESIKDIFTTGNNKEKESQIKAVNVNWTGHSNGVLHIARNFEPNFKVTETNKRVLRLMLLYFTGNKLFEKELKNGSLEKGILLIGGIGTGKSLLFKIFRHYTREIIFKNAFKEFTALEIIDNVNISGASMLEPFGNNHVGNRTYPICCYIDDIASKNETVKHFGTELNVIEQLLSLRYNVYSRHGILTHATSNKFPSEMTEIYDARTTDRMVEMFNVIELNGKSFRK